MRWCRRPDGSSSANVEVWSVYIGGDRRAHSLNAKIWKSWCSSVSVGAQFIRCDGKEVPFCFGIVVHGCYGRCFRFECVQYGYVDSLRLD